MNLITLFVLPVDVRRRNGNFPCGPDRRADNIGYLEIGKHQFSPRNSGKPSNNTCPFRLSQTHQTQSQGGPDGNHEAGFQLSKKSTLKTTNTYIIGGGQNHTLLNCSQFRCLAQCSRMRIYDLIQSIKMPENGKSQKIETKRSLSGGT